MLQQYEIFMQYSLGDKLKVSWGSFTQTRIYLGCNSNGPILIDESVKVGNKHIPLNLPLMGNPKISVQEKEGQLNDMHASKLLKELESLF